MTDIPPDSTQQKIPGALAFMREVYGYARPYWFKSTLCSLTVVMRVGFMLAMPLFYREIFDSVLVHGDSQLLTRLLLMMVAAFAVVVLTDLAQAYLAAELAARIMGDLRRRMYLHLQRLSESFYVRTQIGDLMSRFTNDLFSVDWAVSVSLVQTLFAALMTLTSAALLFHFDWRLALATLLVLPITAIGPKLLSGRVLHSNSQRKQEEAEVAKVLQEDIAGHRVIQAFGLQKLFYDRFQIRLDRLFRSGVRSNLDGAFLAKTSDIGVIVVQLLIVSAGAFLALGGYLSSGDLVAFLTVLFTVGNSVKMLTQLVPDLLDGAAGMQRVNALLEEEADDEEAEDSDLPPLSAEICFEGVSFSYTGKELNLDDVSFTIPAGDSVAFVGRSGSGKSTVLNLLTRFYDSSRGAITVDGRELTSIPRQSLRAQVGAVFQHTYLFNTTVRENIRQGQLEATDAEVEEAARAAEIHDFITGLPDGYDTMPGEGGGQFSGGQRQRIALARAILRDPAILVLDEATSALDPTTEAAVNATLERLAAERTMLSVTHRLTSIANMDRIFVLERGRVVEQGKHKELLNLKGTYYEMWQEFALELTGDVLLGEKGEQAPGWMQAPVEEELDDEFAELDELMEAGSEELTQLIQQFEAEEKGADQNAQQMREINQRWAQLVGTDRLTGLPNKLSFLEALVPMEIQQAQRQKEPIGFLLVSADNLGIVNENYGRNAGDQVIGELASFLQSVTKGEELLGHLDGTNFALMLYPATATQAGARAETLRSQVAEHTFSCADSQIELTISAGVTSIDSASIADPKAAAEEIFGRLNSGLYAAKQAGGNRVETSETNPE
jgi:ATP-binding cassette, subfamily B, bacterial